MQFGGISTGVDLNSRKPTTIQKSNRRKTLGKKLESGWEKELYKTSVTFYDEPPQTTLSIYEFEKYAVVRLKVLRIIERNNMSAHAKFSKDWADKILSELDKQNDLEQLHALIKPYSAQNSDSEDMMEARKFDHISHFLLRLAYARTEEQRRWFVSLELDFFWLKLNAARTSRQLLNFLKDNNFPGIEIDREEKKELSKDLVAAFYNYSLTNLNDHNIYKVPFKLTLDLVRTRKCLLRKGWAYISFNDLLSVVSSAYRSYLSECLSMIRKNIHLVEEDQRIVQIIKDFDQRHTGGDFSAKKGSSTITVADIETFSHKSFPLCMKSLYEVVKKEHHIKHFGRLQLGLFFKGMGVPLEEATKFWRSHFTRRPEIDGNRFDKQYLYNIRHMYGQEGKRADYTPYSCMKVITSNVGPGEHHGCPFKHSDQAHLRVKLNDAKVPSKGVKEIIELVEKHHYQIACQKYFEYTHDNLTVEGGVNHPNQYFEESRDTLSGKKTLKAEERAKTKRTHVFKDGHSSQVSQIKGELMDMESQQSQVYVLEESQSMEVDFVNDEDINKILSECDFTDCEPPH